MSIGRTHLNEAVTDDLVSKILMASGYDGGTVTIERQATTNASVNRLLTRGASKKGGAGASKQGRVGASKQGGGGSGRPDFIITDSANPQFVILIESKADTAKHESTDHDRPADFAIDGVLHYASFTAPEYTTIAIAVSGMDADHLKVTTFVQARGENEAKLLENLSGQPLREILPYADLLKAARRDRRVESAREQSITDFSRDLHEFIYSYVSLSEANKPLLVAGTLIALRDNNFRDSYKAITDSEYLKLLWIKAINTEIENVQVPDEFGKKEIIKSHYASLAEEPSLHKLEEKGRKFDRGVLFEVVRMVDEKLSILIDPDSNQFFDVVGQFYGQFLKYTGGDKKALGIVLTPRHITELFCDLAELNVTKGDKVLDPCTGTGAFLIAAMGALSSQTLEDDVRQRIRSESLIGIEQNTQMYTLAASNMVLHGDGRSNLYMGDCFAEAIRDIVKAQNPRVGFVNPPYAQDKKSSVMSELHFVENMLDMLVDGGIGIAIVPMSCATSPSKSKENILAKHTLTAVMSMPNELFSPVGVVTCIMVFTAHTPHESTNKDTWFGYWKNDGFVKTKHRGRIDADSAWAGIRNQWLDEFHNRRDVPGRSVMKRVTSVDEWCAEAYMETDYSTLTQADFEKVVRDYALFQLRQSAIGAGA